MGIRKTPISIDKDLYTNYFFVERFTRPVSPLGWSIIGPLIEHRALKQPLRYLGFLNLAAKKLIHLIDGYPYVLKSTFRTMFQIVPKRLITQDKLNTFMIKEDLKEFNFMLILQKFPILVFHSIVDPNWFPPYHFFVWKRFKRANIEFYNRFKKKILSDKSPSDLIQLINKLNKQTDWFLKLHRWSFIYSEVFYGLLKGLIRMWVSSPKVDEDIEVAEKLCSGFKENVTAEMDRELQALAKTIAEKNGSDYKFGRSSEDKIMLAEFIGKNGHRSESLDIYYPTWAENPTFIIDVINQLLPTIKDKEIQPLEALIQMREKTVNFCKIEIKKYSNALTKPFKLLLFKIFLTITQRFMILREIQRNQWQMILSQKRRVVLQTARLLKQKALITAEEDIFFLHYRELKNLLRGKLSKEEAATIIKDRKLEMEKNLDKDKQPVPQQVKTSSKKFKGTGVSTGKVTGRVVVLHCINEMKKLKTGDILVTKIVDSSWTPIFNVISGLITEVGGMLSHGAVVAREMKMPAVVGIANATKLIPSESQATLDGKSGLVEIL